jgi:adenylosuccinate synthase
LAKQIVLLSGRVSSGKSTLCTNLVQRFGVHPVKTKDVIARLAVEIEHERGAMQDYGELLDRRTKGGWVRDELTRVTETLDDDAVIVVDAVRIANQIESVRKAYGHRVFHIHLEAPEDVLAKRYKKRKHEKNFKEFSTYAKVLENKTEQQVETLADIADVVIKTDRCTKADVVVRAASHLGLYGREYLRLVDVLVGGEYGSEGKGHIASYLAGEYDLLVRVGGPNAGHKVFEDPVPYTHHQLPSGTRFSEARLLIGPGAVVNAEKLLKEIADCNVDRERLSIDPQVMIITKDDIAAEEGLVKSIGSTGQGVGNATARRILKRGDDGLKLARHIPELRPFIRPACDVLDKAFFERKRVFVEGTQGTGLSLFHGHYPHVTSRDTTVAGCLSEAGISPSRVRRVVMVVRSYPIRVQDPSKSTSGPMSQELKWTEISRRSRVPLSELQKTEKTSTTNRKRRVGEFDWELLRKAASLNGPTDIALTFSDYISVANRNARRFEQLSEETIRFIEEVERVAGAPVSLISTRFESRSIIDRRAWYA